MWIICEYNFYLKLRCSYFFYLSVSVVYFCTIFCVCLFVLPQESLRSFAFVFDAVVLRRMICMEHKICSGFLANMGLLAQYILINVDMPLLTI